MSLMSKLINEIVQEHYTYISESDRNSIEMEKKIAILKAKTKKLQAGGELAESYFFHQMQERDRLFSSANKVLDKAMEEGDIEFAQIALETIKVIHKKSPFKDDM